MLVVPGSQQVKRAAEAEGLDKVFLDAGAEWRESGCSMCLGMNGDLVPAGHYSISTSNRNFEGRQGVGARTLLASPETAAASAIRGRVTDPREFTPTDQHACRQNHPLPHRRAARDQHRHRPDHSGAISHLDLEGRFGKHLFADWRYDAAGNPKPDFVLNQPEAARLRAILVAGRNIGCGSSREHAPWALLDFGFHAVDQHRVRRHLPHQLPEERPAAGGRRRGDARVAARQPGRRSPIDLETHHAHAARRHAA